jgi:stage III sporulation protein AA
VKNVNDSFHKDFYFIVSYLPLRIQKIINNLNEEILNEIQEIRIRAERPVVLILKSNNYFITYKGILSIIHSANVIYTSQSEITEAFNKICDYSIHSHYEDVLNGYVTLKNGARVGVTGTAVFDKTTLKGIRNIDGLNFRIPRYVDNCADFIVNNIFNSGISNLLIAGPPSSGKTTILKDLIYQLSSGKMEKYYKICVIDERKELVSFNNIDRLGFNTDVLYGYPKSIGISMAVRTLSPDIIICDEIGVEDIDEIIKSLNSGVSFIFTIHAQNYNELKNKYIFRKLYDYGCIDKLVIINSFNNFVVISDSEINEVEYERASDYCRNNHICNNLNDIYQKNKITFKITEPIVLTD